MKGFAQAVRPERIQLCPHREAWDNLAFIQTAYESMVAGRPLDVPEFRAEA